MSIVNTVVYTAPCPACHATITQWQTYDEGDSSVLYPWQIKQFEGWCSCGASISAAVEAETEVIVKRCKITLKQETNT